MIIGRTLHSEKPGEPSQAWGSRRWLLVLMGLALLLRLPGMGESLWLDETFMTRIKVGDTLTLMQTLLSDYHPPAYLLLMHFWIALFGDSEISVRMLPLLTGLLSIPVLYELGRRLAGARAGFFAATFLALSPTHIWYSHEARPYATVLFCVLLATLAWYRLADPALEGRAVRRWTWTWFVSLGFALFTHYYILAFWAAFTVLPWWTRHPRRKRLLILGLLLGLAFAITLFVKSRLSPLHTSSSYLRTFTPMEFYDLHFGWFLTGNSFTPRMGPRGYEDLLLLPCSLLALAGLLVGLYRLLLGDLRRAGHLPGWTPVLLWLALPTLLLLLPLLGFPKTYIERSALPALPFFYLFLALGIDAAKGQWTRRILPGIAAALLLILLVFSFKNQQDWTVYKPRPDWRAASQWLDRELDELSGSGSKVHDLYALGFHPYALSYYDDSFQLAKTLVPNTKAYERIKRTLEDLLGKEGWPGEWLQETLTQRFAEATRKQDQLRTGLRLRIQDLARTDPKTTDRKSPDFFLLTWPGMVTTEPRVKQLLEDPQIEIVDRRDFRLLSLFHIRRR